MSSIRIGDYLNHPDPIVSLRASNAQAAVARLLQAIRDAEAMAVGDDVDLDDDPDEPSADDDMPIEPASRRAKPLTGRGRAKDIRSWARANGYSVGSMGRIPADIAAAYRAAHPEVPR